MSDEYIQTIFHHLNEGDIYGVAIDKDHFSMIELHAYTKERGYVAIGGFHYQNPRTKQLQLVESDQQLLDLVKNLKNGDTFELFIKQIVDVPALDESVMSINLLSGPEANLAEVEQINVDVGELSDLEAHLSEVDSSDSDLGDIPENDDSEVDDELRVLRAERRCKKQRKKAAETQEIPVGEAGGIDRGFEQDPDQHVEHWYRKDTFCKAYKYFIQPIPNLKMWPESTNITLEPPENKRMPGRPRKCRRKAKDEPSKKWGKLSKKGVKMTCSKCHQIGHNKNACKVQSGMRVPTQPTQTAASTRASQDTTPSQSSQATAPPQSGQATAPAQLRQPSSVCDDISAVRRVQASKGNNRTTRGRGMGRRGNGRGAPFVSQRDDSSSQVPSSSVQKRGFNPSGVAAATEGRKRSKNVGFGLYSDPITGIQVMNPGTSSERILQLGTNVKSASETNIDIGFKPCGLKWNGRDAVTTNQLQQIKANKRNQVNASTTTSTSSSILGASQK